MAMRIVCCALVIGFGLSGQIATSPKGSIRGQVVDGATGTALSGFYVFRADGGKEVAAAVDAEGRFSFHDLPAGTYRLTARRGGTGIAVSKSVRLAPGQELDSVRFEAPSEGSISGRVLDQNKRPKVGVEVQLLRQEYVLDLLRTSVAATVPTNEEGRYRFSQVEAGRAYRVLAGTRQAVAPPEPLPEPAKRQAADVPTFYPDALTFASAAPTSLSPGEHREAVDIRVARGVPYCVEGTAHGDGAGDWSFDLEERDGLRVPIPAEAWPKGHFRFCGLPTGDYRLLAQRRQAEEMLAVFGVAELTVVDRDLPLTEILAYPMSVPFDFGWDTGSRDGAPRIQLTVELQPIGLSGFSRMRSQFPRSGVISFAAPGDYRLLVTTVPDLPGWYLKQADLGGDSVLHRALSFRGVPGVLALRLAVDGGSLAAHVADDKGNAVPDANLLIFPADVSSEGELAGAFVSVPADQFGVATSGTLAPGWYRAIACLRPVRPIPEDVAKLFRAASRAEKVEIGPRANVSIRLRPSAID